eukprot:TRINITY_DN9678_c0_g1_i2.p1 TRINITY_DN9678_c0_g1~~TRINITY_DN9678_c0_g1_i2.p1  ORF type:complete len:113 (-),score=9.73 TRINITY_DN9678_c0_g1_i2:33-371(-)
MLLRLDALCHATGKALHQTAVAIGLMEDKLRVFKFGIMYSLATYQLHVKSANAEYEAWASHACCDLKKSRRRQKSQAPAMRIDGRWRPSSVEGFMKKEKHSTPSAANVRSET